MGRRTRSILLIALACVGCRHEPAFVPDTAFAHARAEFEQGELAAAAADAEKGLQVLDGIDANGAWRFRALQAEVFIWQGRGRDALALLAPEPIGPVSDQIKAQRLCLMGQAANNLPKLQDDAVRYVGAAADLVATRAPQFAGEVALTQGTLRWTRQDLDGADGHFRRALDIAQTLHKPFLEASARGSLGLVRMQRHQYADAVDWFQSAAAVATSIQARASAEKSTGNLGWAYLSMGELDRAQDLFTEAEAQARRYGLLRDQQIWLSSLGGLQMSRRDYESAEANFRQALSIARKLENKTQVAQNLTSLATALLRRDQVDEADRTNAEALVLKREAKARDSELYSLVTQADIAIHRTDPTQAIQLLGEVIRDAKTNLRLSAEAQAKLATVHAGQGDPARANQEYREAIVTIEQARDVLGREEFKLPFATNAKPIYDAYVGFLMDRGNEASACAIADLSRAQTLTQGLGVRPPFSTGDFVTADRGCSKPSRGVVLAYGWRRSAAISGC